MWQSASVLVGQPLRKLSLGIERLQQKKFRNFANFIMFQQTIFLIRNLFNLNRLCLRADLKNSMKKISRKFKFSVPNKINISVLTKSPNNALQHRHNLIRYYISTISVCHPKCIERRVKTSLLKPVKISLCSQHTVILVRILIVSALNIHIIHHSNRK